MTKLATVGMFGLIGAGVVEGTMAARRMKRRRDVFRTAEARALEVGRPLVVVGDPDAGMHTRILRGYSCGDICVDLSGCPACPVSIYADLTKGKIPEVADDSGVVFVSCVLEYVTDPLAAERELLRIAGGKSNLFSVNVEPHSATAMIYPGSKHRKTSAGWKPITRTQRALATGVVGLGLLSTLAVFVDAIRNPDE